MKARLCFLAEERGRASLRKPVDSSLANLERLARSRYGDVIEAVYHFSYVIAVIFTEPGHVAEAEDLFPECHVHPISSVQVGLAWKEEV